MGLVDEDLSCHMPLVDSLLMGSYRAEGASENPDCLSDIGMDPHSVGQPGECVKIPLKPFRVSG